MARRKASQASVFETFLGLGLAVSRRKGCAGRIIDSALLKRLIKPDRLRAIGLSSCPPLALVETDLPKLLFAKFDRQLAARGLFVKAGALIDATLIKTGVKWAPKGEGDVSERDPNADCFAQRRQWRSCSHRFVRYRGLACNRTQLLLTCMAINLHHTDRLIAG